MSRLLAQWSLVLLGLSCLVPTMAGAQPSADSVLTAARESLRAGQYDEAIQPLEAYIRNTQYLPGTEGADVSPFLRPSGSATASIENLRDAYLILITAHILAGNEMKSRGSFSSWEDHVAMAHNATARCLGTRELRHTVLTPPEDYPPEMETMFQQVRGEIFGAFHVLELHPDGAEVSLDGEGIARMRNKPWIGDEDLLAGSHTVVVSAKGYKSIHDSVTIAPGMILARTYVLTRTRGPKWYLVRGVVAVAAAGILVAAGSAL